MSKILTPLELKVMNIFWEIESGFVKDLLEHFDEPKPAYNTISTIARILKKKGFLEIKAHGRTHEYFPTITQDEYQKNFLQNAISNVFQGNISNLVSTLFEEKEISKSDLDELKQLIKSKTTGK